MELSLGNVAFEIIVLAYVGLMALKLEGKAAKIALTIVGILALIMGLVLAIHAVKVSV